MAELIRIGMVLDSAGVVRGAREATQALGQVRQAASQTVLTGDRLVDNFNSLRTQFQRGAITVQQYRDQLRTTRADLQSFTNTTRLSAEQERYFATQAGAMTNALRAVEGQVLRGQRAMLQVSGGIQTLAASMEGGRINAQALAGGLLSLGAGPVVIAISGVITLLALMRRGLEENKRAFDEMRDSVRGFSNAELAARLALAKNLRDRHFGPSGPGVMGRLFGTVTIGGKSYTVRELNAYIESLERQLVENSGAAPDRPAGASGALSRDDLMGDPRFGGFVGPAMPTDLKPGREVLGGAMAGGKGPKAAIDELGKTLTQYRSVAFEFMKVGDVLSESLSTLGASLADGFKGIGKAILGIIGGMMQQIGHALVMFGLAGKAIRNFIKNPALAVAVGAGLIVLGAALAKSAQGVVNRGGEGGASASVGPQFSGASDSARGATIVQIIGQTSGEVIAQHTYENARYRNRGGSAPNTSQSAMTIPVTGQVVVRRV